MKNVIIIALLCFFIGCAQTQKRSSFYVPTKYRTEKVDFNVKEQSSNSQKIGIIKNNSIKEQDYINKVNFSDRDQLDGVASWYGPNFHGKITANGEIYNENDMTAAHRFLPMNTWIEVINLKNKKKIVLRINDRGPYAKNRILDCSKKCAKILDYHKDGTVQIKINILKFPKDFNYSYGLNAYKLFVVQFAVYNDKKRLMLFKNSLEKKYQSQQFKIDHYAGKYHLVAGPYQEEQAKQVALNYKKVGFKPFVRSLRK